MPLRTVRPLLVALALCALALSGAPGHATTGSVEIVRDRYGVPHVFGSTATDVSYGAGYALAQDRLWQMHTFRLVAKGHLSTLLGPIVEATDKTVRFYTYTAAERAARFATYPADVRADLEAFAAGVNAHIAEIKADPTKLPFEFVEYGVGIPADWTVDDSIALSDVLILQFGSGGGNELAYAGLLKNLIAKYGNEQGEKMFNDLILTADPDSPASIPDDFNYHTAPTYARQGDVDARRALNCDARLSAPQVCGTVGPVAPRGDVLRLQLSLIPDMGTALSGFAQLQAGLQSLQRAFSFGSNAQIAGPAWSATGNTLQTAGPQVGYLVPQWLADIGLHAADGSLDATGMTFAGAGPAVLIGRGNGFAWTTTTGASDLTDTYVEQLDPANDHRYLFNGVYENMECRTETYDLRGIPFDSQEICRTRHGPVISIDSANHVAYSLRYAWFNREGQTVEGFFAYNRVRSLEDFATYANYLSSNHNMFYVDDQGHYGYWTPSNMPLRAAGFDMRLPLPGDGSAEWQGLMQIQDIPHAVDFGRGWLANWNNLPARGWPRERTYAVVTHAADVIRALDPTQPSVPDPFGGLAHPHGSLDFDALNADLRYAAFRDHDDSFFRRFLPSSSHLGSDLSKRALEVVNEYDGFLMDRNTDGFYDSAGQTIEQQWIADMIRNAFASVLGSDARFAGKDQLWHVLMQTHGDPLQYAFTWVADPVALAASSFDQAVGELQGKFANDLPESWKTKAAKQHYQRLNADLFTDTAESTLGVDNSTDLGVPGDVPDQIRMDRGTYNHIVQYLSHVAGGSQLGLSNSRAGSVIPPGQSGTIDLTGHESKHYRDQMRLYADWTYKPMPMTLDDARS